MRSFLARPRLDTWTGTSPATALPRTGRADSVQSPRWRWPDRSCRVPPRGTSTGEDSAFESLRRKLGIALSFLSTYCLSARSRSPAPGRSSAAPHRRRCTGVTDFLKLLTPIAVAAISSTMATITFTLIASPVQPPGARVGRDTRNRSPQTSRATDHHRSPRRLAHPLSLSVPRSVARAARCAPARDCHPEEQCGESASKAKNTTRIRGSMSILPAG